jgi:diaminohydroxyphosphoribosylaminopyrimidine deaminase/5-amino-6-(5-phosphoribosylamino)uracil reductase
MTSRTSALPLTDVQHMHHALTLAERALGCVAPNPAVGCVIVSPDGRVVGRGWTQAGGRPHAETVALAQAGEGARGATAYVTLEPCAHFGQTPPCADALSAAGVARVVAAVEDPDPRVKGQGFEKLRAAGIEVITGVIEEEAAALNAGFFLRVTQNRPLVTLKIARSKDGKTIRKTGGEWITGEEARRFGHLLRAKHDAILIGVGTALADDPELTCRLPGLEARSPQRIVLDTELRLPAASKLAASAREVPVLVMTAAQGGVALRAPGVEIVEIAKNDSGRLDLAAVLRELARRGITRLLVEGGATVAAAFLQADLVDRLEIFTAPIELGDNGGGEVEALAAARAKARLIETRMLGDDVLETCDLRA